MTVADSSSLPTEIWSKVVLSDLVKADLPLKKAGAEFKANCPFHDEGTPSFYINDKRGFFHCFGCGAHGDAVDWLVRRKGISRSDALAQLGKLPACRLKSAGGGKLNRSETVTVRLDPQLNYLCELASRAQRRTKSSFIEWAVAESLASVTLPEGLGSDLVKTIQNAAPQLWHVDEADRVAALAMIAPALLTHDEQLIWRLVRENGYVWRGRYNLQDEWVWEISENGLIKDRLRQHWAVFKAVAAGDENEDALPKWLKNKVSDLDDDVPF